MLVLSYPTFTKFRLSSNSPISVHRSDKLHPDPVDRPPEWLRNSPTTFVQQIIIRGGVEPWISQNMTTDQAIRGPLSRAFLAREIVLSDKVVDEFCFQINRDGAQSDSALHQDGCLLLDPTAFWQSSIDSFREDPDVLTTIFSRECSTVMCPRDLFLGMPTTFTGIKPKYRSNRKRSIDFSLTLFLVQYDHDMRNALLERLTSHGNFVSVPLPAEEQSHFIHVFYRQRKAFGDYLPLLSSYAVFTFYLYYSARKFEMVSSRWSLAFAAAFAVGATLLMTTGVCAHLELSPTLWGAEIFPYIALILGLENTLCITRAVVYTPPSLDVSSRISHGLAQEGYSLCKYFVMELLFLAVGYATRIAEIQEFCMFAFIGLVIDFYMQMFFYAPCLTFDLQRLSPEEKRKFALKLFHADIPHLHEFVPVRCPMRKLWPSFFRMERAKKRTLSESQLDERDLPEDPDRKGRGRSNSVTNTDWTYDAAHMDRNHASSNRLRLLYFVTRTRIFQRTLMVVFVIWTVLLAFVVHEHKGFPFNSSAMSDGLDASHPLFGSTRPQWEMWSERTFKWWPALFAEFNISLTGEYISFLPPIVLKTTVDASDSSLYVRPSQHSLHVKKAAPPSEVDSRTALKSRISWLESQLRFYLAIVWLMLLISVIAFVLYACFWGRWRIERIRKKEVALTSQKSLSPRASIKDSGSGHKSMVESIPVVFSGHRFPIESVALCNHSRLISCCQEGRVCLWNIETGERILKLRRSRGVEDASTESFPAVWCIAAKQYIAVCGCADGSLEVACLERNKLIGVYLQSRIGIVHVLFVGSRVVLARLDGSVEFLELTLTTERPTRVTSILLLNVIRAHQKPISLLSCSSLTAISASYDHTLKLFDLRTCQLQSMLHAHSGPVTSICTDHVTNTLFTACEQGVICWWNMSSGELLRSLDIGCTGRTQLACSADYLLGYASEGDFFLWSKDDGSLVSRIAQHHTKKDAAFVSRSLVALGDQLAVTASEFTLTFWDLQHKAIIHQIDLGSIIDKLIALDNQSVLCQCSNTMYRITSPTIRIT
ncbi:hypothetical protein Q1695_013075 [Nippostrongylus brasiliensis]|nr:hypothetical protein Q1695_013075 [Nippostrongylus brasiliensis]